MFLKKYLKIQSTVFLTKQFWVTLYRWDLFWFRNARDRREVGMPQKWSKSVVNVAVIFPACNSKFWNIFPYSSFHLYKYNPRTIQRFVSDTTFGLKDFRSPRLLISRLLFPEPAKKNVEEKNWGTKVLRATKVLLGTKVWGTKVLLGTKVLFNCVDIKCPGTKVSRSKVWGTKVIQPTLEILKRQLHLSRVYKIQQSKKKLFVFPLK